jgi:LAO/AO transport system kinase
VLSPGAGDDIQSAKAGILEIADIFIINKIDRDNEGAEKLRQELIRSQELSARHDGWRAPVILTSALDRVGITEVVAAIKKHQEFIEAR